MVLTIELIDRFQALLHLESTAYNFSNYISTPNPMQHEDGHSRLCKDKRQWRRIKIIGWMYNVIDTHLLDRELVCIAMSYMDRYLSKHLLASHSQDAHQLVGMTSLFMAIKIFRNQGKCAAVASFAKLSKGLFSENDLLNMEQSILDTLQWRMHPPTPQTYLELLINFLPPSACLPFTRRALFERIKFLLELSVTVPFFFCKKPSSIAVATFMAVMENEEGPNVRKQTYRSHFRYCARSIAGIYCDSQEVVECRNAMKVVHKNALHQMDDEVMNEKECTVTPVASEKELHVVAP